MISPYRIKISAVNRELAAEISRSLAAPRFVGELLVQRGCTGEVDAREFLDPPSRWVEDPWVMSDMERAVEVILSWRGNGRRLCVFGDYDLDGISGAALLIRALRRAGGWNVCWSLPSRFEDGYGLSGAIINRLHAQGVSALILVDTGISAHEEIAYARSLGMDVVVVDHHRPAEGELPAASAILDPWKPDCPYPNKALSAVGVALKLTQALYQRIDLGGAEDYLDLVALGTLSDLMPLERENRYLLRQALGRMIDSGFPGVRVLCRGALENGQERLRSQDVLFRVAPLMNAPGRLDRPDQALALLLADTEEEARSILQELKRANSRRRKIEADITAQAVEQALRSGDSKVLVLSSKGWHLGVLGIVASKLVQSFRKPVAVISVGDDGVGRASVRGVDGFNWHEVLQANRTHFLRWGGHASAAGFAVETKELSVLPEIFERAALGQNFSLNDGPFPVEASVEVSLEELSAQNMEWLDRMEPFGKNNPPPLFLIRDVSMAQGLRVLRGGHLQFVVSQNGSVERRSVVGFGMGVHADWLRAHGSRFDLVCEPVWNYYRGKKILQLQARAFGKCEATV